MNTWKKAFSLATLELKNSFLHLLLTIPLFLLASLLFTSTLPGYITNNYVGFDLLFLILFSIAPSWLRPKQFQYQKVSGVVWATPTYVMQMQLPIPIDILTKSRLIIYHLLSVPVHVLLLTLIYLFAPSLQTMIDPLTFFVFSIIWICFGVYAGTIMPASDVGDKVTVKTMTVSMVSLIGGLIVILTFFHLVVGYGVVNWTIMVAQKWPFISSIISITLAIISFKLWLAMMKVKTKKFDYF